jgi:hypothetical protein
MLEERMFGRIEGIIRIRYQRRNPVWVISVKFEWEFDEFLELVFAGQVDPGNGCHGRNLETPERGKS